MCNIKRNACISHGMGSGTALAGRLELQPNEAHIPVQLGCGNLLVQTQANTLTSSTFYIDTERRCRLGNWPGCMPQILACPSIFTRVPSGENLWHVNARPQVLACVVQLLFLLWLVIEDHDNLFIMAEVVHCLGIGVLIYKLWTKKNAGGEDSLKDMLSSNERHAAASSLCDVTLLNLLHGT